MKILLAEDSKALAAGAKRGLEAAGLTVDVAADGKTGFNLATSCAYDCPGPGPAPRAFPGSRSSRRCGRLARTFRS